jgi:hypothetical protein
LGVVVVIKTSPLIAAAALTAASSRIAGSGHSPAVHGIPHRHIIDPNDPRLKASCGMLWQTQVSFV